MHHTRRILLALSLMLWIVPASTVLATIHNVSIIDFAFSPATVTVNIGDTVRWTHNGSFFHSTTSNTLIWDSGTMSNGNVFDWQFTSPGSFPYHCSFHSLSMNGTVNVNGPNVAPNLVVPGPQSVTVPSQSVSFNVSATDANPQDTVTISLLGLNPVPTNTTPTFTGTNPKTFNWSPICVEAGTYYAKFQANDGKGGIDTDSVQITVQCTIHYILMDSLKFKPQVETVGVGEKVCWIQQDPLCLSPCFHTTTSDSGVWNSDTMFTNDTFCFIFNNTGIYPYHCIPHQIDGMTGTIVLCAGTTGDVNASGGTPNLQDVIYLVNFVFDKSRVSPPCNGSDPGNCWSFTPLCRGDINGSGGTPNLQDVIYLVNFVFDKSRVSPPCNGSDPGNCWTPVPSGVCCF